MQSTCKRCGKRFSHTGRIPWEYCAPCIVAMKNGAPKKLKKKNIAIKEKKKHAPERKKFGKFLPAMGLQGSTESPKREDALKTEQPKFFK